MSVCDEVVDGFSKSLPAAVVVEDEDTAFREPRIEMLELVKRRVVEVGIESKERDCSGALAGIVSSTHPTT